MAILAVFIPLGLLVVLVALGRYEELMLPPLSDEPEEPETAAVPSGAAAAGARSGHG
ncbi:hypothetical protein [Streptomyces odontomachi]|uniref:hypothetical protein n=1 Tax=Streptomyces odontomachi TaxID=2944940 RepID=UPI0021086639|nr:hypothetical protein [Streptomyces sp. ODS25]